MFGPKFSFDVQYFLDEQPIAGGGETGSIIPVGTTIQLWNATYVAVKVILDHSLPHQRMVPLDVHLKLANKK